MSGFIPEITTTITVNHNLDEIDNAINTLQGSEITATCFSEVVEMLGNLKSEFEEVKDPLAESFATTLSANQSQIISMYHKSTGMMMNSVDISKDGDGVYLVGNTATSVDGFPYPLAIEQGTRDHWVSPVTFDALHWTDSTGEHWSKGHMVSGITADPYVDDSIDFTWSVAEDIINETYEDIFKQF